MTTSDAVIEGAHAKINLGLKIGHPREDGYHPLQTVFQEVELKDTVQVAPAPDTGHSSTNDRLMVKGPIEVPEGDNNLVIQAVEFLRHRGFDIPPLNISLTKRIPTGSGLGGGSSDAASVLTAIDRLIDASVLDQVSNSTIAESLGADIPFFFQGGTCFAEGIGEQLHPLPGQWAEVLVVKPDISVATEWAYDHVKKITLKDQFKENTISLSDKRHQDLIWKSLDLTNHFEPVLCEQFPELRRLRGELSDHSPWSALTGSGSAMYALFENGDKPDNVAELLRPTDSDWKIYETETV